MSVRLSVSGGLARTMLAHRKVWHKHTHTAVATDGTGRKLAEQTVVATSAGHLELVRSARDLMRARSHSRTAATCHGGCRLAYSSAARPSSASRPS